MIKVALPKGRIAQEALKIFEDFLQTSLDFEDRKLILKKKDFEFMLVRSQDVPVYVERGAADIGVVGLDVLEEKQNRLVRLLDLGFGKCKVAIGSPNDYVLDFSKPKLKIATKMENITKAYFAKKAISVDIIKLYGSIELAPLVGMADAIVDLVETGSTLRQNNLKIDEVIMEVSAYLVANSNSFYAQKREILEIQKYFKNFIKKD
ncbi:ATP phosphoribosyltransferase [Helicobacter pullorum]|uniref:ATP phosphoribosyltransferase n=1 Tax=Helicobacter pullorum TaxID=35818 RepID=UPI000816A3F5|nr:ATP phosphoribosyltransferase [Helicobacter pullorum]OCR03534.1 ATP phosphoribosyltransferase [Helicobacter pullorum]OCR07707.1 ATP phosphoribosyltransferase [Helicobacter pullorum]OCR11264.1 ATP phosphoribosyltransferase [Helicobacter pullorum]OCR13312.1 ATP phosphoribosyltransferase [Helicobacter pullorum]